MTTLELKTLLQQELDLLDEMSALAEKMAAICETAENRAIQTEK